MTVWQPFLQLAVGYNNAAGLVALQSITPTNDKPFYPIQNYGTFDPGQFRTREDGTLYVAGYASAQFVFNVITRRQVEYLQDTYCATSWSGKVTVKMRTDDPDTYANYNAILLLTKLSEATRRQKVFVDYVVSFTRMEAI